MAIRKQVQSILSRHGFDNKFTVREIGFERGSRTVVTIKAWKPNALADEIKAEIKALPERPLADFEVKQG